MVRKMKLNTAPFELIRSGKKIFELRLYDDKRRKLEIGDTIIFSNVSEPEEQIAVYVKALLRFTDFESLFEEIGLERCGNGADDSVNDAVQRMYIYYSKEDIIRYGALAIKVEMRNLDEALTELKQEEAMLYEHNFPDGMK